MKSSINKWLRGDVSVWDRRVPLFLAVENIKEIEEDDHSLCINDIFYFTDVLDDGTAITYSPNL